MPSLLTSIIFSIAIVTVKISMTKGQWISPPTFMPKDDKVMVPGYYKNIITLIGGERVSRSVIEYNISDKTFNYFKNSLSIYIYGYAQNWIQMGNAIYIPQSDQIYRYDLSTKQLITNWKNVTIPINIMYEACIASSNQVLYVVGGINYETLNVLDLLQIYDISSNTWSQGPHMNIPRQEHACVVSPKVDVLYVIAGFMDSYIYENRLNTAEYISLGSLDSFRYTNNNLSRAFTGGMAVVYDIYVYIIGGYDGTDDATYVHIINVLTNTISVSTDKLVYSVHYTAPIIVGQRIYAFGGAFGMYGDRFQYYDLPDPETTESTTDIPSNISLLTSVGPMNEETTSTDASTNMHTLTTVAQTTNEAASVASRTNEPITDTLTTDKATIVVPISMNISISATARKNTVTSNEATTDIEWSTSDTQSLDPPKQDDNIDWILIGACWSILVFFCIICGIVYMFCIQKDDNVQMICVVAELENKPKTDVKHNVTKGEHIEITGRENQYIVEDGINGKGMGVHSGIVYNLNCDNDEEVVGDDQGETQR